MIETTSDFDHLMSIWSTSKENSRFKSIAEWLAELCVVEADTREPNWNFKVWLSRDWAKTVESLHGKEAQKWEYLNDCHDVLDHKNWHLCVFQNDTQALIRVIHDLFGGREVSKQELKRMFKKRHLSKLMELLTAIGLEDNKYGEIKLKGVERKPFY